jgi:Icc-related predicted phosphoesterase
MAGNSGGEEGAQLCIVIDRHPNAQPGRTIATMKIQLLSDLHLEVAPLWQPTPAPHADVLVLAGDIGSYQTGSLLREDDFGLSRFSPRLGWPTPVLFVPGNHEYDGLDFDTAHARLRTTCEQLGITWLERTSVQMELRGQRVRFLGTTLWSDFDALVDPRATLTAQLKAQDKAMRAANFYLKKTGTTYASEPMLAPSVRTLGLQCQSWLRAALAQPFDAQTVVVTHFAPSLRSADPRYGLTPGTAGFCNALEELLPQASLWLHGHLHCPSDYVQAGCRVVANPLGYARKNEQARFQTSSTIDFPGA